MAAFDQMDQDGSGFLEKAELEKMLVRVFLFFFCTFFSPLIVGAPLGVTES